VRVLVSGSSGFIGTALLDALAAAGHEPLRLVRGPAEDAGEIGWNIEAGRLDPAELRGVEGVVHMAGAGIGDHRWTDDYKREILKSRTLGTGLLARALAAMDAPPSVLVSGSAVGYYGDRGDEELTEDSRRGTGFLADVVSAWEAAAAPAATAGIRTVLLRTGLVLAPQGGTLGQLLPLFRFGLGGPLGSGRQWWSWIALDDEVGAIVHCLGTPSVHGPVNATAPHPVTNAEFTKTLGKTLHRPAFLRTPAPALAAALGAERAHELVLASQRVVPRALERSGYTFAYPTLAEFAPTLRSRSR
jgi:uncharacterized protein